jgi:tetratricopeptide (TPR) repeat protein
MARQYGDEMSLINAFVGHSFTQDDAELVEKFLKFFSRLEKMNETFCWVHAEAAEPRQLRDKVIALIQDRNLFIGICTRKELVVAPGKVSKLPLTKKQIANSSDFEWKTSDWIIQEIGLAQGRGLEILLLIENGVRKPGGLQGDVEYIPFDRSVPEGAFGKIVEMITALTPRTVGIAAAGSQPAPPPEPTEDTSGNNWTIPMPSWRRTEYELAMFHFIYSENDGEAKKIDEAFLATPEAREVEAVAVWKAHNHCYRLIFGKGGDLKALQALVLEFPENAEIREFHARALSKFDKHLDAATEYEVAAANAKHANDRARLWGYAAAKYAWEVRSLPASNVVRKLRQSLLSNEIDEQQFLTAIRQFAEVTKNRDLQIAISERLVDLNPDDFEARFALAYMYSEAHNNDLALNHYLKVPRSERSGVHWNNLGVEFQHLNLPIKAVDAYRKSEDANETLAMANLGYKMLGAGFLSEARAICDKALAIQNFHKNVGQLLVRLNEVAAEEDKALGEAIEKSRPKVEFFRCFGRALSLAQPTEIDRVWVSPEGVMNATIADGRIEITGSYDRQINALSAGLGMLSSNQTVRQRVKYTGTLEGRAIIARVQRSDDGDFPSASLLSLSGDGKTLMYFSDDVSEIIVSENPSGVFPKIFAMKRQTPPPVLAPPNKG